MTKTIGAIACVALAGLVLAGCSADDAGERPSTEGVALEGLYRGEPGGAWAWASFRDGHYVLWEASTACVAADAPSSCARSGTFEADAVAGKLRLTDDASGEVLDVALRVDATKPRSLVQGTGTASIAPRVVGGGTGLVSGSPTKLVDEQKPLVADRVELVGWRTTTYLLMHTCAVMLGNGVDLDDQGSIFLRAPPPIMRENKCGAGS